MDVKMSFFEVMSEGQKHPEDVSAGMVYKKNTKFLISFPAI
jgi:hypothetical protein